MFLYFFRLKFKFFKFLNKISIFSSFFLNLQKIMNPQQNERTLFRFVTLRQPQKGEDKTRASITSPYEVSKKELSTYKSIGADEVKNLNPTLLEIGKKAMLQRTVLSLEEWQGMTKGATQLTEENEKTLWLEYQYQLISAADNELKDSASLLLYANYLLKNNSEKSDETTLKKTLFARFVVSKNLFEKEVEQEKEAEKEELQLSLDTHLEFDKMKASIEAMEAKEGLEKILKNTEAAEKKYIREDAKRQAAYQADYDAQIKKINEALNAKVFKTDVDMQNYIKTLKYPIFNFQQKEVVLKEWLSKESNQLIEKYAWDANSFSELKAMAEMELKSVYDIVLKSEGAGDLYMKDGGLMMKLGKNPTLSLMTFRLCPLITADGKIKFSLAIMLPSGEQVQSVSYKLLENGRSLAASTNADVIQNNNGSTGLTLFNPALSVPASNNYSIDLTIGTNVGSVYQITTKVYWESCIEGKITQTRNRPTWEVQRVGVRNIGIADYKRVVQHVCCYEPTEVAHIENVMATEMKEHTVKKNKQSRNSSRE
jgi:hypothetical protein